MRLHSFRNFIALILSALLLAGMVFPGVSSATIHMDGSASETAYQLQSQVKDQFAGQPATKLQLPCYSELNRPDATAQNFVPPADSNEMITVIVELQQEPVKVVEAQAANTSSVFADDVDSDIRQEHQQFRSALKPLQASIRYEFSYVFNGFSIRIPANKVDDLVTLPGVKAVYPNTEIEVASHEPSAYIDSDWYQSAYPIGANELWGRGYEGAGIKVGVLDSGVDYHHPSLKGAFKGGYDFVDNDDDPMETRPDKTKPKINGKEYHTTHGTHVAGIIVGRGNNEQPGNSGKVRGVAPQADLYAYRVLGPYGSGNEEKTLRAIEHAVYKDKVDVLNLSLGGQENFQYTAQSVALDNATKAGVVVVVAAGNSGPDSGTLETPAGTHAAISVAASYPPGLTRVFDIEGLNQLIFPRHATSSPVLAVDHPLEAVDAGFGTPDDYYNKDVKGKLVVVSRGNIDFGNKSRNAKQAGAAALIIFNNEAGDLGIDLGDGNIDEFVPTYGISRADGLILKNYFIYNSGKKVVLTDVEMQDMLASFSSRGPALPDFTIKPDIAAPGVAIISSVPAWDGNYEHAYKSKEGTSFAAPHIAGAAALLLEYSSKNNLDLTPDEIKALIMNHAVDLKDRMGNLYKLTEQGAGRVDLKRSVEAPAIALVQETVSVTLKDHPGAPFEYETGSLSFGAISPNNNTFHKTVRLKGISDISQQYSVSFDWPADGGIVTSSAATISPGQTFDVYLHIPSHVTGNFEGHVILQGDGGHEIRLPVSAYVGKEFEVPVFEWLGVSTDILAPNGHPNHNKTTLSIKLNKKINDFKLTVLNLNGEEIGDAYVNPREQNPGILSIDWNGRLDGNPSTPLVDGLYYLVPVVNGERLDHLYTHFLIDNAPPEVQVVEPEIRVDDPRERKGKITGTVYDLVWDYHNSMPRDSINQKYSIQTSINMKAVNKDTKVNYKVNMNENGTFTIDIPYLKDGRNEIDIYAWDSVKNGYETPSRTISFDFDPDAVYVNARTESKQAYTGEEVKVDIGFSVTEAVYSGTYVLLYDSSMVDVLRVEPSVTFVTYTQQHPEVKLDFTSETIKLDGIPEGWEALVATTSMPPSAAYSGDGILGTVVFSGKNTGIYEFKLGGLELESKEPVKFVLGSDWIEFVNAPEPPEPKPEPEPEPKPEPEPSLGGSSSSRSYSTPLQPAGKSLTAGTYTVTEKDSQKQGLLLVSSAAIRSQLNDKEAAEVKLDIADIDWNDIHLADIRLARSLAEELAASGKAPLLSGTDFEVLIPAESLVDFIGKNGDLTVRLALAPLPEDSQASPRRQVAPELTVQGEKETVTKPIRVGLKWSSSAVKDGRKVGVYAKDAKEAWTYYAPGVRWDKDGIRFTTVSLGSYTAQELSRTFDDIRMHWSKDKIEFLAAHQLVEGKGRQNTFKPNDQVTQAEFASQLDRLTGSGKTWKDRIAEPGAREPLTREKMVVMLVQALQLKAADAPALGFADQAKIGADARAAVAVAVSRGYMKGMGGNTFSPKGTSTRAQAATVLARALLDLQSES
ncbi:S8 family serine peptidase [Paenibacillus popilliae]|uniref:Subtilisin-like serine protease n=1 Tax=Paenibacillus popilliae ATCC 14706 TaxID=1212764 RepID=M9LQM9_PAEPP|nr:S8 family serine peptidase [Paenibacillus popilliae]GAC43256.1 subtilisin-like serine protease [Paenibacillus popilliae ATCC 14706]